MTGRKLKAECSTFLARAETCCVFPRRRRGLISGLQISNLLWNLTTMALHIIEQINTRCETFLVHCIAGNMFRIMKIITMGLHACKRKRSGHSWSVAADAHALLAAACRGQQRSGIRLGRLWCQRASKSGKENTNGPRWTFFNTSIATSLNHTAVLTNWHDREQCTGNIPGTWPWNVILRNLELLSL